MTTLSRSVPERQTAHGSTQIGRRLLRGFLWALLALLLFVTALPVLLLFVATGVPFYLSLGLAVVDIGLLAALFWF
ncbi:MAG: hypothetical protein HC802_18895 [Caldilineaceae bacterium]|nr:hypothetical protein [Caldilineaceae bacterium]